MSDTGKSGTAGPERKPVLQRWFGAAKAQELLALAFMLALVVFVMSVTNDLFLTPRNLTNLLVDTTTVGIIAVFTTMLMIGRGLDLSVASTAALCGVVIGALQADLGIWAAVAAALGTGAAVGLVNGVVVTYIGINPLIATLGMLSIARGLAFVFANGLTIPVFDRTGEHAEAYAAFAWLSEGRIIGLPFPVLVMLALFAIGIVVLRTTAYGRSMYAIGGNEVAARLASLPVSRYRLTSYVLSGMSAALAGVLLTSRLYAADPRAAPSIELTVITAVVLGGTSLAGGQGSLLGTLLGVFLLGGLINGLKLHGVSTEWQNIAQGFVLLLAVGIDQVRQGNVRLGILALFRQRRR